MSGNLTDPLWGTGYGSKRHLVDGKVVEHATKGWRAASSRCGQRLSWFADAPASAHWLGPQASQAEYVASRLPRARCLKIAAKEVQA